MAAWLTLVTACGGAEGASRSAETPAARHAVADALEPAEMGEPGAIAAVERLPDYEPLPYDPLDEPLGVPEEVSEEIRRRLESARVTRRLRARGERLGATTSLLSFYEARGFQPAWFAEGRLRRRDVDSLVTAVRASASHGLEPRDYHLEALVSLPRDLRGAGAAELAGADLLLTETFVTLGGHLLNGKVDPVTLDSTWNVTKRRRDLLLEVRAALDEGTVRETLEGFAPTDAGYRGLRAELARYREIGAEGGWARVPGQAPIRASEATPAQLSALRERLTITGDLPSARAPRARWDGALTQALRSFQRRRGMAESGVVDASTLDALNVSAEDVVLALEANLERWRWLPEELGETHVFVNIAGFRVVVVRGGEPVVSMRAIVGRPYRRTPVFSDAIRYVVVNPTWTVPPTILREDILPDIQRDPEALARRGLRVMAPNGRELDPARINWDRVRPTSPGFSLVQPAGPDNALGVAKLMFPNPHGVYLHGTPRQDLFDESERALSSGCIRVERPLELAAHVINSAEWSLEALQQTAARGVPRTIHLIRRVPVHIQYWTAWIENDTLHLRRDVYERDDAVITALGRTRAEQLASSPGPAPPSPAG